MCKAKYTLSAFLLSIFWLAVSSAALSQSQLVGNWRNEPNRTLTLWMLRGDLQLPVDSTRTDIDGAFKIQPKWNIPPGMYLISDDKGRSIKLLLNGETVRLHYAEKPLFMLSPDNEVWQTYTRSKDEFYKKQTALEMLIEAYPANSKFRKAAVKELNIRRKEFNQTVHHLVNKHEASLAAKFIRFDFPPMLPIGLDAAQQNEALKAHLLYQLSNCDTVLIQSDLLPNRVLDFLTLFQHHQMPKEELEIALQVAIDQLLSNTAANPTLYLFYMDFLFEGFERLGFEKLTDFMGSLPHFDVRNATLEHLFEIERIVGHYRKFLIGNYASPIQTNDINGKPFDLYNLDYPFTLLLFWAETCPHCTNLLPELADFVIDFQQLGVVAIALGDKTDTLLKLIEKPQYRQWVHIVEQIDSENHLVNEFRVRGTPTMLLLDSEKRIISRPNSIDELRQALGKTSN